MRYHILTAALVAVGFLATSKTADAQYGYPFPSGGGYYQPYAPTPQYAPQPYPYSGYGGGEAEFVRSLYHRYLGREPDPEGMNTWLWKLVEYGGDTNRVIREFIPAARHELNTKMYSTPAYRYPYPAYRLGYR